MKGSFAKARVLYAPVEEIGGEERLLRACRIQIFWSSNLTFCSSLHMKYYSWLAKSLFFNIIPSALFFLLCFS